MIRTWLITSVAIGLVVYAFAFIDADKRIALYDTWQEVLMYEISPARPLVVNVPGDSTRLVLDMLAVTKPETTYDPKKTYPFEVDVRIKPVSGLEKTLRLWCAPRVSLSEFPPRPQSLRGARVLDNSIWVTDAAERLIDLQPILRGYAAEIRMTPVPGPYSTVLTRVFAERLNSQAFGETRARRLSREERRALGSLGTALGFLDMPAQSVLQAVSTFRVRLDSVGKRGRDYTLRRALLSSYRASAAAQGERPSFEVSPERWVAINLQRDTTLRLLGPKYASVRYGTGYPWQADRTMSLDEEGQGTLEIGTTRPTTLVLGAERPILLSAQADSSIDDALASDLHNLVRFDGEAFVESDLRRTTWTRLDPEQPVCFEVEAEEKSIRVSARGIGAGLNTLSNTRLRLLPGGGKSTEWKASLVTSPFERFVTGEIASDAVVKTVRLKPGTRQVCARGPSDIAVRASALDESVLNDAYKEPYDRIAAQGFIVQHGPHREIKWANLAPLTRDGQPLAGPRSIDLLAQVRLLPIEISEAERALLAADAQHPPGKAASGRDFRKRPAQNLEGARALLPAGIIHAQRVFVAADHRARGARREAWVEVSHERAILVSSEGPVSLAVRAPVARLPAKVEVLVDGVKHTSLDLRVSVLSTSLNLSEGAHRLSILGPEGVRAFVRARAADYEPVWLERQAFELLPDQTLRFDFEAKRWEPLAISLQVFSESPSVPYRVQAQLSGMLPQTFVGLTNDHPAAHFWDRDFSQPGGMLQASFDLPRARTTGPRSLEIGSKGKDRLFVRVVLLGQQPELRGSSLRVGRRKDP